ncbi:hypothetical protein BST61_g10340 [Cercospora zeina]
MLILSGYQPPAWLNAVGARFHLDPVVLQEHLEFRAPFGRRVLYTSPSLPSTIEGLVKLRYFTIGIREDSAQSSDMSTCRKQASDEMDHYLRALYDERNTRHGDTIARGFYVHSPKTFSIEQQITVGVQSLSAGGGWTGVTRIDSGNDRENGLTPPWRATNTVKLLRG